MKLTPKKIIEFVESLKFDTKTKLIPAVVQDYKDNTILMLAYMNKESLIKTLQTKKMWYYSRSRKKLWMKGEQSGHLQLVKQVYIDCDNDCLLFKVKQVGEASCHTGYRSCFYRKLDSKGNLKIIAKKIFDPKKVYTL